MSDTIGDLSLQPGAATSPEAASDDPLASTPEERRQFMELMVEIDRLRLEAERLRDRVEELEELADTDPLAPVLNRRAFVRELDRALAFAARHGGVTSLLFVDLDDFKRINDEHGHAAGDSVLTTVAEILLANVRETDIVGRLGGDEFAVALVRSNAKAAQRKAARLRDQIRAAFKDDPVSASVGATSATKGEGAESLIARADDAMYAAKKGVRG